MAQTERTEDDIVMWIVGIDGKKIPVFGQDVPSWEELEERLADIKKRWKNIIEGDNNG